MSKIVLNDVTNLNALSVINDNFDKLEQELQNKVLYRDNPEGEPNGLEGDLDANGNSIFNVQDLTIAGNFSVNGKSIEEVIDAAAADIEANAEAAVNAATAAGLSASSASTSATSAAASASTATTKASEASTSASNAASSATAAASSASTATTQAGIATTKASEASASASAAATSASSASTSASTATTQAGIATTQATNAASSASSASTSATSAANSAAAAATALDSFDDRYLGSKSSDPTVDNDGNALLTGALYYNTTSQTMKVYDGANWITATAAGTTAMNVYKYVATAGQTTFSGAAAVGGTMSYTSGNIIVFVNGVSLDSTDYTATNGTSVVLGSAASLNDEVVVVAFKSFTVADTYTQSAADALLATKVSLTGNQTVAGVKTFTSEISAPNTFGMKNRLINGSFLINQRNSTNAVTTSALQANTYFSDRWYYYVDQASKMSLTQSTDAPAGFTSSNLVTVLATDSTGPEQMVRQKIEGYNIADLGWGAAGAKTCTLSFWVKSSVTGTFGGSVQDSIGNYSYPFLYTISSANTWEQKTVSITGPTSGTFGTTSGTGLILNFEFGPGYQAATANTWTATNSTTATGSSNFCSNSGATLRLAGVQFEKGTQATSFDFRSYGTELALCQRYYFGDFNSSGGVCYGATNGVFLPRFPVPMRAAPTLSFKTGSTVDIDLFGTGVAARSISFSDAFTVLGCRIAFTVSGATTGQPGHLASNPLQVSAEL